MSTLVVSPAPESAPIIEQAIALGRCGLRVTFVNTPLFGASRVPSEEHPTATACTCGRSDCPSPGKHPVGKSWQKNATCDESKIRDQYSGCRIENPNVGIVLGAQHDGDGPYIIAIDVDDETRFQQLVKEYGPLPETARCDSGRGYRLLYALPADTPIDRIKNITALGGEPGVDVKVRDGQIVVAPSWHYSGKRYSWSRAGEIVELPAGWILAIMAPPEEPKRPKTYNPGSVHSNKHTAKREQAYLEAAVTSEAAILARMQEGQRNNALYRSACRLLRLANGCRTVPDGAGYVARELLSAATASGLLEREIVATLASAENKVGDEAKELPPPLSPNQPSEHAHDDSALSTIQLGLDTDRVTRDSIQVLTRAENTYARGGILVRVAQHAKEKRVHRDATAPVIRHHSLATLTDELSTLVRFQTLNKDGEWRNCGPPEARLRAIIERGTYPGLRHLDGIRSAPTLRADGTVAQTPGYDETTEHLLAFDPSLVVPVKEEPTYGDAIFARDELLGLVAQFPFKDDADRSAWLGLVLTLLARPAIDGPCPMFLATGNIPGCGKSRLIDVASLIATGHEASRATQPENESDAGKLITSIVIAGDEFLLFDNVDRPLGGAKLNALLTGARWKDRVLGVSVTIDLQIRVVIAATGNNVLVFGDMLRRVLPIRLDSEDEHPERRTEFTHPDLLGYVRENRYRLVAAGLTILRAWHVSGRQRSDNVRMWGSFEGWGALVPHALAWIGLPDPGKTRDGLEDEDPFHRAIQVVVQQWGALMKATDTKEERGLSIREAIDTLTDPMKLRVTPELNDLREALGTLAPGRGGTLIDARTLGHVFRRTKRRVIGRLRLVQAGKDEHADVVRWTVIGEKTVREKMLDRIDEMVSEVGSNELKSRVSEYLGKNPNHVETAYAGVLEHYTDWRVLRAVNGADVPVTALTSVLDGVPPEAVQASLARLRAAGSLCIDDSTQVVSRMP